MKSAVALIALLASGCTHLVWYGRSDDRRHVVSVIEQRGRQHVRVDMVDGPEVLGVGVDALVFGDGGELAYPAQFADGWAVIHHPVHPERPSTSLGTNGGTTFDAIGEVQLHRGQLLYTAERAGKWHMVHDGVVGEPFDAILAGSLTVSSTGRTAYAAQSGRDTFAVVDGQRSAPLDGVGQLRFSADGTRVGFIARRAGNTFVIIDGLPQGPFESIAELQLGPPDVFVARADGGWRVYVDGRPGEAFERIAGLHTTGGVAYAARRARQEWIIDGARQLGPFTSLKSQLARDASGRLVFVAQRGDAWVVSVGDVELGPWSEVEVPAIGGAHVGFIAEREPPSARAEEPRSRSAAEELGSRSSAEEPGSRSSAEEPGSRSSAEEPGSRSSRAESRERVIVLDGKELSSWDWASSLALSADGTRLAFLARRESTNLLVVDGQERTFDVVVGGSLAFSKDGRRFACVTGEKKTRQLFITRDDGKRTTVDMEELVAALSRVPPEVQLTSPDVTLLRRWVEAELEH